MANPQGLTRELGYYVGVGIPEAELDSSRQNIHSVTLVNAGATYQVNQNLFAFGGPGYSYQRSTPANGPTEHRHRLNGNIGLAWVGESFGVNISYDSGPNAVGLGFVVRTGWFGSRLSR